ncbi:MAG TPA: hypothetical protein VKV37_18040, partial [Ktedonobacteraceae bacterium]|jgi:hypothetical protein|nr:hypothetical protein [Ktedonobacteraceae bacterium]
MKLAKTLYRITAPLGMVAWTECELPITSSPALQQIFTLVTRALDAVGHRYAPPTELELLMMQRRAKSGIKEGPRAALLSQAEQEMADLRFCGIIFSVTCSGTKPQ